MRRPVIIRKDLEETRTLGDLTEVFESIASLHISKIRNRVVASKLFFGELWQTYQALRIDPRDRLKRRHDNDGPVRDVFMAITAEGKLSGAIDEQIIDSMLAAHAHTQDTDIVVIGAHGQTQLQRQGTPIIHAFPMPASDATFSVSDIIEQLTHYRHISVFYQTYESLRIQKVVRIDLTSAVRSLGEDVNESGETVSGREYIFEPDIHKIAEYMESVMMGVALIQLIMESKLAQYANRFNNMTRAKHRATELTHDYRQQYLRSKRSENDNRLKEVIYAVRQAKGHQS
jgi:ATP synthase F1 gamma subunit